MIQSVVRFLETIWKKWLTFGRRYPRLFLWLKISAIFTLFLLITDRRLDPDFGWHLQAGNYFRKFGIPVHDIFTYTARNFAWIDHEWGNDVITSYLYQLGGYLLVAVLFAALWTAALFVNARKLPFQLLWLGAIAMLPYMGIRPTIWTVLGLAILIRVTSSQKRRAKALIPIGFIIWANLQGGFIIGLAYLGYLLLKERKLSWATILLASALATFINPYGPRLYVEIARTLTDTQIHHQIKEWSSFYIPLISLIYIVIWASGFWLFAKKRISYWLSFSVLTLLATLSASRNLPIFVIASLSEVESYFLKIKKKLPKHLDLFRRNIVVCTVYLLFFLSLVISVKSIQTSNNKAVSYPVQAVSYLKESPCSGNLFNSYNYGGYLIWQLPQKPVYIDGRMPSWKDAQGVKYIDRYFDILNSSTAWQNEFKQYNIQCALLSNDSETQNLVSKLESHGWTDKLNANNSILLIAPTNKTTN